MFTKTKQLFDQVLAFINYWYFRYLMVTELYIVERWERIFIHCFFLIVFMVQWYFNQTVLLSFTASLFGFETSLPPRIVSHAATPHSTG